MTLRVECRYPTQAQKPGLNGAPSIASAKALLPPHKCGGFRHPMWKIYRATVTLDFVIPSAAEGPAVSTMLREKILPNSKRQWRWLPSAAIALAAVSIAIIYSHQRLGIDRQ